MFLPHNFLLFVLLDWKCERGDTKLLYYHWHAKRFVHYMWKFAAEKARNILVHGVQDVLDLMWEAQRVVKYTDK